MRNDTPGKRTLPEQLAQWVALIFAILTIVLAIFWPQNFAASPRPLMFFLVSLLPAMLFGSVAARFKLSFTYHGWSIVFNTVGPVAIAFGFVFALDFLMKQPDTEPVIIAEVIDEDCDLVDVTGIQAYSLEPRQNILYHAATPDRIIAVLKEPDDLTVEVTPLPRAPSYRGTIPVTDSVFRRWRLGIELVTEGGTRACQE